MNDITQRLRSLYVQHGTDYVQEAADEIERLREQVTALEDRATMLHASNRVLSDELDTLKATPPNVPDGFVLVPIEPTPEMLYAAFAADKEYSARMFGSTDAVVSVGAYDHYVAMLAAAPKPGEEND